MICKHLKKFFAAECSLLHNQERSSQNGPQLFPPQFHGQIDQGCEYEKNSLGKE